MGVLNAGQMKITGLRHPMFNRPTVLGMISKACNNAFPVT